MRVLFLIVFFVWGLVGFIAHLLHKASEKGAKTLPAAVALYKTDYLASLVSLLAFIALYWAWTATVRIAPAIGDITEAWLSHRINIAPLGATWIGALSIFWGWNIDSIVRAAGKLVGWAWAKKVPGAAGQNGGQP